MLHQAISLGSAAAALGALRMDMLTPELREIMPFDHINEAWEIILEKAENGCPFCQYMIGNIYYFLDIIEIEGRKEVNLQTKKLGMPGESGKWNRVFLGLKRHFPAG